MQELIGTRTTSFKGKDESEAILRLIIQDYKIQTVSLLHVKYEDILLHKETLQGSRASSNCDLRSECKQQPPNSCPDHTSFTRQWPGLFPPFTAIL